MLHFELIQSSYPSRNNVPSNMLIRIWTKFLKQEVIQNSSVRDILLCVQVKSPTCTRSLLV